ncbi:MAG: hypothetical protein SF052_25210 [Bacteroidia bacterium]|nr:hypothetical protein [Bacteroidia bacterium]
MMTRTKTTSPILHSKSNSEKGHFFNRSGDLGDTFFAKNNQIQPKKKPIQRKIQIGKEGPIWAKGNENEAYTAAGETVLDKQKGALAKWFVRHLLGKEEVEFFGDKEEYSTKVSHYLEKWIQSLQKLGIGDDERMDNAFWMYNNLENAKAGDEAVIYKIADEYKAFKERWIAQQKAEGKDYTGRGLIYYPRAASQTQKSASASEAPATSGNLHTMPLNFSWLAALVHHQVPVRVVVPLDDRVLIRAQGGKTDMSAVKSGKAEAPLSATAREVLGLLRGGFYQVSQNRGPRDYEVVLQPTGKPLLFPDEIAIDPTMAYEQLVEELYRVGIKIPPQTLAEQIAPEIKKETAQMQEEAFKKIQQNTPSRAQGNVFDVEATLMGRRRQNSTWKVLLLMAGIIALILAYIYPRIGGTTPGPGNAGGNN